MTRLLDVAFESLALRFARRLEANLLGSGVSRSAFAERLGVSSYQLNDWLDRPTPQRWFQDDGSSAFEALVRAALLPPGP